MIGLVLLIHLIVRNYTAENIQGRGALLQTHHIDIRHSIFNRTSAPAILFQPSLFWHDGPPARNVTLAENLYIHCNEGMSLITVFDDIRIESSTFYFGNYSQCFFYTFQCLGIFLLISIHITHIIQTYC